MRDNYVNRKRLLALLLLAPMFAGCSGTADMFSSELLSKDADWFSRSGRVFVRSIEAPPLTPDRPITAEDLVSAEGYCAGMAPAGGSPADANAATGAAVAAPVGTVALGHTECDVVRGIGVPPNVSLSNNGRGDRVAVITYSQGPRAGIYTFTAGRLSSVERGPEQPAPPKVAKSPRPKKKPVATAQPS